MKPYNSPNAKIMLDYFVVYLNLNPNKSPFPKILLLPYCEHLVYAHTLNYLDWLPSYVNTLDLV